MANENIYIYIYIYLYIFISGKPMKENIYIINNGIFVPQLLIGVYITTYFVFKYYFLATGIYIYIQLYIFIYMYLPGTTHARKYIHAHIHGFLFFSSIKCNILHCTPQCFFCQHVVTQSWTSFEFFTATRTTKSCQKVQNTCSETAKWHRQDQKLRSFHVLSIDG